MPNLTKLQLNHAEQRINEAKTDYITKYTKPFGDKPTVQVLTEDKKIALIKSGKAVLKGNHSSYYRGLTEHFTYPVSKESLKQQAVLDKWQEQVNAVSTKAEKLKQTLLDELIMSPDGAAALARIATTFA
jgi:hypothetical protein